MDEYITIVDSNDQIIGKKLRSEITKSDIYRVSSLWVFDKNRHLLVSQRPLWKKHDPGKWTESAVGTVEHGETYESNLVKEVKEELGLELKIDELVFILHKFHESKNGKMFGSIYAAQLDAVKPSIRYNVEEVPNIDWVSHDDMLMQLRSPNSRFVGSLEEFYLAVWEKVYSQ